MSVKKAKSKRSLLLKGFGLIQWQGQTFKRSENGSPVFAYFPKQFNKTYLVIYSLNKIFTFDVSIVKR
jgi:hypothetical protein